MNSTYII